MIRVGILGGGQLGRMLLQAAANYPAETHVMENDPSCPAATLCHHFHLGNIRTYEDVLNFGRQVDVLTIEIEQVNVDALELLEKEGIRVIPKPAVLRTIQNKILQKEFYRQNNLPTAPYCITQNRSELINHLELLPAVHKLGVGGYDGRGVTVLNQESDLPLGFDEPAVLEKKIEIKKEIAVLVAVAPSGETKVYPSVEMIFDPNLNLLDYQVCPADINTEIESKAAALAIQLVEAFQSPGLFAVEMFLDHSGNQWINEVAPRVHNSGHHTIEAHYCSQFDMLWRILMGLPLGNSTAILPSLMINVLGAAGFTGDASYLGLEKVLQLPNAFLHLYGKKRTKPGRKMGHITLMGADVNQLKRFAEDIKTRLQVVCR
ncbi:MAG: 5-(carboxyamino)imidazole ribonucleotide synthase [Bacteroidetes bacterium]|nr:5-(carboxyamino)imidazole ribonucleotide synthase [Bacteroidota bacterium]